MLRVLFALVICLLPEIASAQTVLWFSGVENGSATTAATSEFTQFDAASNHAAQNTTVKTGAWAFNANEATGNGGFGISKKGLALSTGYFRMWWRTNGTVNLAKQSIARWLNSAQTITFGLYMTSGNRFLFDYNGTTITTGSTTTIAANTWYLLEFKSVVSASVGGIELKVNGVIEFTSLGTNTSSITALDQMQIGPAVNEPTGVITFTYDDMMICSGSYCPSGGTIARQGAAGTPTYNTWTKNSCTGGTIDGCWSDTPFSATSNATSSTVNNAQTMLVSTFAATQSGHGTETVGPSSTINACKTFMIAKGASGTPSINVRRRIAGTDTDTTISLTTSDAAYDDGIWTTAPGNLRGSTMEIGVVQNQTTVSETVEDMWMMCDYLNNTAPIVHRTKQD